MVRPTELLAEIEGFALTTKATLFADSAAAGGSSEQLSVGGVQVPRITNELWTARQRQGHSLHELSYRACFKAELPRFFLERLSAPGDVVFDPFMGRGTTLLEAALSGRVPHGNDANPLARTLIEARLDPPALDDIAERVTALVRDCRDPGPESEQPELDVFYEERTLGELRALRRWFLDRDAAGELDRVDRWLRMVCTNRLTGHSSGFFSTRTMPPNQAVGVDAQRRINLRLGLVPPRRDIAAIVIKKSRVLLRDVDAAVLATLNRVAERARILIGDAASLPTIKDGSVQCTVTSPPFLNVVNYAKDNWLRCWFNGVDAAAIGRGITMSSSLANWCTFLEGVFAELYRVTRPGGWVVFEVGEVRRGELCLEEPVLPVAAAAGFEPVGVVVHAQQFTKTANCWGVANNTKGTNTNRLVLLRRPNHATTR
ncbi:MAG: DNA modification methylase [Planctomycetes bacterium]|jgi:hypothetical protein|nr:DNA modification methylase [Planctomycetota bacterium]